jgi:uncharacterized OB-fold protein
VGGTKSGEDLPTIEAYRRGYEEEHRLRGFRSACGFISATWGIRCPRCGDPLTETVLPDHGTIVAFSVQTVPSDEFLNDAPYAYVVVALPGGGRVTGWVPGVSKDSELPIGTEVQLMESYRPGVQFQRRTPPTGREGESA